MRRLWLISCSVLLLAPLSLAKEKLASHWDCAKPSDAHSIDVGDQAGHSYAITKTTCTASKSSIGGVKEKEGIGTQFSENKGNNTSWHGAFVVTAENGDKIYYSYSGNGMSKDAHFQSGDNKWSMTGGTGKFAKATGQGTCSGKGKADDTASWDCQGEYTLGK